MKYKDNTNWDYRDKRSLTKKNRLTKYFFVISTYNVCVCVCYITIPPLSYFMSTCSGCALYWTWWWRSSQLPNRKQREKKGREGWKKQHLLLLFFKKKKKKKKSLLCAFGRFPFCFVFVLLSEESRRRRFVVYSTEWPLGVTCHCE
jgi:hypothetical protein